MSDLPTELKEASPLTVESVGIIHELGKDKNIFKCLFIFGTRPEAIKLAPLIKALQKHKNKFSIKVCVTAQHRQMVDQVLNFFKINTDYDLNLMEFNQSLFDITENTLKKIRTVLDEVKPDIVFVQGDTTTAFIGALAGFYSKIKVAHIEAGLRSNNKHSPYPEEINRVLIGHLAEYHFAPTERARQNLINEGVTKNIWVTGNTGIDALFLGLDAITKHDEFKFQEFFKFIEIEKKIVLVTGHRRESFGNDLENICFAIREIADKFENVQIVYPVHLNPNVQGPVKRILRDHKRIHLLEPLDYPHLLWLMRKSFIVLTDSGGIQEEAPSLNKPVLVMRNVTERIEGIEAGVAKLVGTDMETIVKEASLLFQNGKEYKKMTSINNPYGDGAASMRIVKALTNGSGI